MKKSNSAKKQTQKSPRGLTHDVIVIGGGPAGLSFARALADTGLKIAVVEKQPESALANPTYDGRDIALTHLSAKLMKDYGLWNRVPEGEISPIREARVLNGTSSYFLGFDAREKGCEALGYLVSNHLIRRAAYQEVKEWENIDLMCERDVKNVETDAMSGRVTLGDGEKLAARLIVAADSRFSESRRKMGIATDMHDFGRVVMVGRMRHDKPHEGIAHECFHYDQTLAVLPLPGNLSSIVITAPTAEAARIMAMSEREFNADITQRFDRRLGHMRREGVLHPYPLVATYANKFYATRYALMGDAAVGMHPVTAHGYNFGLRGAATLADEIRAALDVGGDIGSASVLMAYHSAHRRATRPIYLGTNMLVALYTRTSRPARALRGALLHLGNILSPAKALITAQLTEIPRARA